MNSHNSPTLQQSVHRRLHHLDSIRGIAAIIVVSFHYRLIFGLPWPGRTSGWFPLSILWNGAAAVAMFFVLSGFVLSYKHFRTTREPSLATFNFAGFLVARVFRIWLPYMLAVAVSAAIVFAKSNDHRFVSDHALFDSCWPAPHSIKSATGEAIDVRAAYAGDARHRLVPQGWSLTIEMLMSATLPAGIMLAARSPWWLLSVAAVAGLGDALTPFAFHFALGIVLAQNFAAVVEFLAASRTRRSIAIAMGTFLYDYATILPSRGTLHGHHLNDFAEAIGSFLIIAVVSSSRRMLQLLSVAAVRHIGRISFSTYLIHMIVILCVTPRIVGPLSTMNHFAVWFLGLAATLVASMGIASIAYPIIEIPTMALGHRVARSLAMRPRRCPQAAQLNIVSGAGRCAADDRGGGA